MRTDSPTIPQTESSTLHQAIFTTSARAGWLAVLRHLQSERSHPLRVLLPAYIGQSDREGSGIYDPIRETGAHPVFYSVDENLRPDQNQIESIFDQLQIDVVLAVHFFGFCQIDMARLKSTCQRHQAVLVEDCAHVGFHQSTLLGSFGDFSVYSLHKFFTVPDGGVLKTTNPRVAEKLKQQLPTCPETTSATVLASDWNQIEKQRIENYQFLQSTFVNSNFVRPLWERSPSVVPHNFPVIVQNAKREPLYFYLLERGIRTTALYYRLVDDLTQDKFPKSHHLSNNILNLPVHQSWSLADLENLVTHIQAFFARNGTP